MAEMPCTGRRDFLKSSMAGGAALAATGLGSSPILAATQADWPPINPAISNLKVVCCHDPKMITGTPAGTFASYNTFTNTQQVKNNLDAMAKALANKSTASEAWSTIFQMPAGKTSWSAVNVAIKVNCFNRTYYNMPRLAVVGKVIDELIRLGVTVNHIHIYDACVGASWYTPYKTSDLDNANIATWSYHASGSPLISNLQGLSASAPNAFVPAELGVGGLVDIIVNCAVNKHHDPDFGGVTMCMKNHFGTFDPQPYDKNGHANTAYLFAVNKHAVILGGTPPRQQLCIMDSLWASDVGGPQSGITQGGTPPARLIMGTFAPAVDYLTAKASWPDWTKNSTNGPVACRHATSSVTETFLTQFGYTTAQQSALAFTQVPPASETRTEPRTSHASAPNSGQTVILAGVGFQDSIFAFPAKLTNTSLVRIEIMGADGRVLRALSAPLSGTRRVTWDMRDSRGRLVRPDGCIARCTVGGHVSVSRLTSRRAS